MHATPKNSQKNYPSRPNIGESELDRNTSLYHIVQLVGHNKDVLDVGCATGYLAELLRANECNVTGIEINTEAAEAARAHCSSVFVADLDAATLPAVVGNVNFDVIVFGDVLEHLREPARLLEEAHSLLREGGFVVVSVPNVAHGAIRLALLDGAFDYSEMGILDETHLRFFTWKTLQELFIQTGYGIEEVGRTSIPIFDHPDGMIPNLSRAAFSDALIDDIKRDQEFETLQFVVKAKPLDSEERLRNLTKHFVNANTELASAQKRADRFGVMLAQRERENEETKSHLASASEEMVRAQNAYLEAKNFELELDQVQQRLVASSRLLEEQRMRFSSEIDRLSQESSDLRARDLERQAYIERLNQEIRSALSQRGGTAAKLASLARLIESEPIVDVSSGYQPIGGPSLRDDATDADTHEEPSNLADALARIAELSAQLSDVQGKLLTQTDALIERARRETQQISTLIHVAQTSKFWRIKRLLAKLAGR